MNTKQVEEIVDHVWSLARADLVEALTIALSVSTKDTKPTPAHRRRCEWVYPNGPLKRIEDMKPGDTERFTLSDMLKVTHNGEVDEPTLEHMRKAVAARAYVVFPGAAISTAKVAGERVNELSYVKLVYKTAAENLV